MQCIHCFSVVKFPYYVYKLNKGDSIFCISSKDIDKSFWIMNGLIYFTKICTNQHNITIALLAKNHILDINRNKGNYYKITAIITTYIMTFNKSYLKKHKFLNQELSILIIENYRKTAEKYEQMNYILAHKYTKYRLIQLILFLCLEFGLFYKNYVLIPFAIPIDQLANILGSNKNTVQYIMSKLSPCYKINKQKIHIIYIKKVLSLMKI